MTEWKARLRGAGLNGSPSLTERGSQRMEVAVAAFTPLRSQRGGLAAGSVMDCYLLKGTSPRPLRCPRVSWGTGAMDGRPPRVASDPPQRSSLSALRGLIKPPPTEAVSFQGTTVKGMYLFSIFSSLRGPLFTVSWLCLFSCTSL